MPKAETEEDLKNEREIIDAVIAANPGRYDGWLKLSPFQYKLDGVLFKNEHWYQVPKLFCEAKQRDYPFGFYKSGCRITVGKLTAGKLLTDTTGLPAALFARFSDGVIAGALLDEHNGKFLISGRADRQEFKFDIEPAVDIPWDRFKIIREGTSAGTTTIT